MCHARLKCAQSWLFTGEISSLCAFCHRKDEGWKRFLSNNHGSASMMTGVGTFTYMLGTHSPYRHCLWYHRHCEVYFQDGLALKMSGLCPLETTESICSHMLVLSSHLRLCDSWASSVMSPMLPATVVLRLGIFHKHWNLILGLHLTWKKNVQDLKSCGWHCVWLLS